MADREQQRVIRTIIRVGRRRGIPREGILANLAAGSVESRFRNLPGGDRDSQGYRQERARYYRNPRNVGAAVNRFYDEWLADADRGSSVGQQAQAVQQSGFPDRYQTRVPLAKRLLSQYGGGGPGVTTTATRTPGVDNSDLRQQLKLDYLAHREEPDALLNLAGGLQGAQDVPGRTVTRTSRRTRQNGAGIPKEAGGHVGKIFEAFYDPAGKYFDSGQFVKGAIGGHGTHVHVSASPKYVIWLGKQAQKLGLHVGENPYFDPVDPVHTQGSYHYRNRAIDVSGDPGKMARFYKFVLRAAKEQ